jgi:hypothetical protein
MATLTEILIGIPPPLKVLIETARRIEAATNRGAKSPGEGASG